MKLSDFISRSEPASVLGIAVSERSRMHHPRPSACVRSRPGWLPTRCARRDVVTSITRTRYARSGDADIAFQVLGDGPADLLLFTGVRIPIDSMDEEPSMARFQRQLASFVRLIRFDQRGEGLSERVAPTDLPTLEQRAADAIAVLDAAASPRAAVLAPWLSCHVGVVLAALHPDRVSGLVIVNGSARVKRGPDYPIGMPEDWLQILHQIPKSDALEHGVDVLKTIAPSVSDDPSFREWFDRAGNLACTPAVARALLTAGFESDVRDVLTEVHVPTFVIQRKDTRFGVEGGRFIAEHIAGARLVELPGADTLYWVGDTRPLIDEIEEFLTGTRGAAAAEWMLATVLFTDIVGSTDRAASLGDERWRDLLDRHDQKVRAEVQRFSGREVNTVGDGFVATFDSPRHAIECAKAIRQSLGSMGIVVRSGLHTGEIELRGDDVAGLAVHIGARVSSLAGADEIWTSSTIRDLVAGSDVDFEERGDHELKGVPGTWHLYSVNG
jgi:class 3 adenylate cyclase